MNTSVDLVQGISKFNEERKLIDNFKVENLLKEFGLITEEVSEIMKQYDDIDQVVDGLGDIFVFSVGTLLKLNKNNVERSKLLLNNVGYSLFVDKEAESKINSKEGFLKLATTELYGNDISTERLAEIIKSADINKQVLSNLSQMKIVAFITSDILEKITKFTRLLSVADIANEDDYTIMEIYVAGLAVLALIYLYILNYDPFIVLDEILKQIHSRKGEYKEELGKWVKDKNQDPSTLYTPDFNKAKIEQK